MNTALYSLDTTNGQATPLRECSMAELGFTEPRDLEKWLASTGPRLFDRSILWLARQDRSSDDQRSDLIGVDDQGNVIVAELKRGMVYAPAVTQALAYAAEYARLSAHDLANLFFSQSGKTGSTGLVLGVQSPEAAAQRLSDHVPDDIELNESQILILIGEDFSPSVLAIADYLNEGSGAATFSVECWQARVFTEREGALYLAVEQILPQPSVRAAIEERREEAKASKRARDPARRGFVKSLLSFLRAEGVDAHRSQGQSYGFQVADSSLSLDFGKHTPFPQISVPGEWSYDSAEFPKELAVKKSPDVDGKSTVLTLTAIRAGSDEYTPEIGRAIHRLLILLTPPSQEDPEPLQGTDGSVDAPVSRGAAQEEGD